MRKTKISILFGFILMKQNLIEITSNLAKANFAEVLMLFASRRFFKFDFRNGKTKMNGRKTIIVFCN